MHGTPGRRRGCRRHAWIVVALVLGTCGGAFAAPAPAAHDAADLRRMSSALEALASRVSPAVVEILVSGYDADESTDPDAPISRSRSQGSGVIVDPDGYILTNYHVIRGEQQVRVVTTPADGSQPQAPAALRSRGRVLPAKVVGFSRAADLAVLKVDASGLPTVPFAKYDQLRQGSVVLAVGSPQGLKNSVSMGLVSAVLRQNDPADPMVYIQTDAAINPGNSGGALVDVDGQLVGINVSILTQSGGNEGIGFAIPAAIARYVYEQIRSHGYVGSGDIGADVQALTPELAAALELPPEGVVVSNVDPQGPADQAGLRVYDRILAIDGNPVDSVPAFVMSIYLRASGDRVRLDVARGDEKLQLTVPVVMRKPGAEGFLDLADPGRDTLPQLGIVGLDLAPGVARYFSPPPRVASGVVVAATFTDQRAEDIGLRYGDIIHSLNTWPVADVDELRKALRRLRPGDPAVLQVERDGRTAFLSFEID